MPFILPKVPEVNVQPVAGLMLQTIPWFVLQPNEFTLVPGSAVLFTETGLLIQTGVGRAVKLAIGGVEIRMGSIVAVAISQGF